MKKLKWPSLIAGTLIMIWVMQSTGSSLKNPAAPKGIISLELAYDSSSVQQIITSWANDHSHNSDVMTDAKKNTYLDFIFIFFYASLLWHCCELVSHYFKNHSLWQRASKIFAGLMVVEVILDCLENTGMLISLSGHISDNNALFTAMSSAVKWLIVVSVIIFLLIAFFFRVAGMKKTAVFSAWCLVFSCSARIVMFMQLSETAFQH